MRKMIIDTDCGSDDAVALMMALKSRDISVEAITAVGGNVPLDFAVKCPDDNRGYRRPETTPICWRC